MLTDDDWRAIRRVMPTRNLPEAMRVDLSKVVDLDMPVRRHRARRPGVTRAKLMRLHDTLAGAADALAKLDGVDLDALLGEGAALHGLKLWHERQANIVAMADWLRHAAERIEVGKRGPDGDLNDWVTDKCEEILRHYGIGGLSRSDKDTAAREIAAIVLRAAARGAGCKPPRSGMAMRRVARTRRGGIINKTTA
jgi:hypothetical protein